MICYYFKYISYLYGSRACNAWGFCFIVHTYVPLVIYTQNTQSRRLCMQRSTGSYHRSRSVIILTSTTARLLTLRLYTSNLLWVLTLYASSAVSSSSSSLLMLAVLFVHMLSVSRSVSCCSYIANVVSLLLVLLAVVSRKVIRRSPVHLNYWIHQCAPDN